MQFQLSKSIGRICNRHLIRDDLNSFIGIMTSLEKKNTLIFAFFKRIWIKNGNILRRKKFAIRWKKRKSVEVGRDFSFEDPFNFDNSPWHEEIGHCGTFSHVTYFVTRISIRKWLLLKPFNYASYEEYQSKTGKLITCFQRLRSSVISIQAIRRCLWGKGKGQDR